MKHTKQDVIKAVVAGFEATMSSLGISEQDFFCWCKKSCISNEHDAKQLDVSAQEIIITALPIVYSNENKLSLEKGLILSRKHEIWGIQLLPNVIVALKGKVSDASNSTWQQMKIFAEKMELNGKCGRLPSKVLFKNQWGYLERKKLEATIAVLALEKVEFGDMPNYLWCQEECNASLAYYLCLENSNGGWVAKNHTNQFIRAVFEF